MRYTLEYDKDTGILRADILERFEPEDVTGIVDSLQSEYTDTERGYLLAYIYEPAQDMPSKETRQALKIKASLTRLNKIAICGAKPVLRMVGKIIVTTLGKAKDTKFFETEETAVAWLRAEREREIALTP